MKNSLVLFGLILLIGFFGCKKELNDSDQIIASAKPAPPTPVPSLIQWQQCVGTAAVDFGQAASEASDGYYVVGETRTSDGRAGAYVSKIGLNGGILWSNTVHGSAYERFNGVVTTADGGCLAIGQTSSSEHKSASGGSLLMVKYSAGGVREWIKTIGGSGGEQGLVIINTSDGGYALSGYTSSIDGDISSSTSTKGETWLVKFHLVADGPAIDWERKIPSLEGSKAEMGYGVAEGPNGDLVVIGTSHFTGPDIRIVHVDNTGQIDWTKRFGTLENSDIGWSVTRSHDGTGFVMTGALATETIWVYKVSFGGDDIWTKTFARGSARSIVSTADGVLVSGITAMLSKGNTGEVFASKGGQDLFVLRLSETDGSKISVHSFGGNRDDFGQDLIRCTNGGYLAIGETNSNNNGDISGFIGQQDIWTVKFKYN